MQVFLCGTFSDHIHRLTADDLGEISAEFNFAFTIDKGFSMIKKLQHHLLDKIITLGIIEFEPNTGGTDFSC